MEEDYREELIDKGILKGKSRGVLHKTAINHFNNFLVYKSDEFRTIDDITYDCFVSSKGSYLGEFSSYLSSKACKVRSVA